MQRIFTCILILLTLFGKYAYVTLVLFPAQNESTSVMGNNSMSTINIYEGLQKRHPFFCNKPVLVMEKKSWEDAWSYCREHHTILASVVSEAEMHLIKNEMSILPTTEQVWIGLHFFPGDGWLWVDNQPLDKEIWGSGGKPQCPKVNRECAILKTSYSGRALRETRSTSSDSESISAQSGSTSTESGSSSTESGGASGGSGSSFTQSGGASVEGCSIFDDFGSMTAYGIDLTDDLLLEAHDCEEKLPFICY